MEHIENQTKKESLDVIDIVMIIFSALIGFGGMVLCGMCI